MPFEATFGGLSCRRKELVRKQFNASWNKPFPNSGGYLKRAQRVKVHVELCVRKGVKAVLCDADLLVVDIVAGGCWCLVPNTACR